MLFHHTLKSGCSLSVGLVPSFYAIQILSQSNSFTQNTVRERARLCMKKMNKGKEEENSKKKNSHLLYLLVDYKFEMVQSFQFKIFWFIIQV